MCNKASVSRAAAALISILFVMSVAFAEIAVADQTIKSTAGSSGKTETNLKITKESPWTTMIRRSRPTKPLNRNDQRAALEAIHYALREVADGSIFVWRRQKGILNGQVKPTSSFRDDKGAICRHLVFTISHADNTRQIESIACRKNDGSWTLSG